MEIRAKACSLLSAFNALPTKTPESRGPVVCGAARSGGLSLSVKTLPLFSFQFHISAPLMRDKIRVQNSPSDDGSNLATAKL